MAIPGSIFLAQYGVSVGVGAIVAVGACVAVGAVGAVGAGADVDSIWVASCAELPEPQLASASTRASIALEMRVLRSIGASFAE